MSDVTHQLATDHQEIMGHLDAIRAADFAGDVARRELRSAKAKILRHLSEEDRLLYGPMLRDEACVLRARQFQERMQAISADMATFFDRYDGDAALPAGTAFATELGTMTQRLRSRFRQEERLLFPLFPDAEASVSPSRPISHEH